MTNSDKEQNLIIFDIEKQCAALFQSLNGHELSSAFLEQLRHLQSSLDQYKRNEISTETKRTIANNISNFGQFLENAADPDAKLANAQTIKNIFNLSKKLESLIKTRKEIYIADHISPNSSQEKPSSLAPHATEEINLRNNINELTKSLLAIKEDHETHDERHKKLLAENLNSLSEISQANSTLRDDIENNIQKTIKLYEDTEKELNLRKEEINKLLGTLSGTAVAGSYESNAATEKKMADWLRGGSLLCMMLIFSLLVYSFSEITKGSFNWEASIFRMAIAFFLSVPSAYLARESAKHRQQQYNHLQTSLDLRALNPFIASLPIEQQHALKINIATKVFGVKDFSTITNDPYPINAQELILELIKRIKPSPPEK